MNYRKIALIATAAALSAGGAFAQSSVQARAEREIRQQEINFDYATDAVRKGNASMDLRDYESAFQYYKSAVDATPTGGKMAGRLHKQALDGFSKAVVAFAKQRISEGRLEDAKMILDVLVNPETGYNKTYKPALQVRLNLEDPTRYHAPALSPKFIANVEEVKLLLIEAQGYYDSGRFDLAVKRYEKVLTIDKTNIAARNGMEMVNKKRTSYEADAYNDLRGDFLAQVAKGWELPVTAVRAEMSNIIDQPIITPTGVTSINRKLDSIIIPKVDFRQASLRQAVDFLSQQAAKFDNTGEGTKGLNIITKITPGSDEENLRVDLSLNDVPLRAALTFVAEAAEMKIKVDPYAVVVVPVNEPTDDLITREYKVPPGFISSTSAVSGGGLSGGMGGGAGGSGGSDIVIRSGARDYLTENGVQFPVGATAIFLPSSSRLIVKNTQSNLDVIESLILTAQQNVLAQVSIETKFIEISQTNLKELGFDWYLGNVALPFGSGTHYNHPSGYTSNTMMSGGGQPTVDSTTGDIIRPNHMTGGLRSGTRAISVNGIDSLLFGTPLGAAPAALAFTGVLSGAEFQVFLRALSQHKSVDLVSAPHVTTQSGKSATVEVVREFRFPSDYALPRVMAQQGSTYQPPIPTTPTSFERRDVGVTLEVEPTVDESKTYITMRLAPRVVEFDGFLNYGSPIMVSVVGGIGIHSFTEIISTGLILITQQNVGVSGTIMATPNVINRPVFTRREVETEVTIVDGQTVVLGGLIREDVQKVQDKVPILGDVPFAGRLFRTSSEQHVKRNMMIFVTANLVDYGGQPILKASEDISTADAFLTDMSIMLDPDSIALPQ